MARLDLIPVHDTLIGEKYRLGPVLGSGGVSTVYRATHLWTEREVAVKLLDSTLPHFDRVREGFLREARATVQLKHPNVVDVLDMGEDDWETVYMVMELLQGPTLRDVLNQRGRLPEEETLDLLLPLVDALEKANQLGIVHRDFKPDNIVLTYDDNGVLIPKLLDFGIAEILEDARSQSLASPGDVIMGTPQYMSPEQACDERDKIGPHTDVWAVGVVWYECLTGQVPFAGETVEELLRAVCSASIDFEPVPEAYVPLLRDALRQPPALRTRSFSELKARIRDLGLAQISVPPQSDITARSLPDISEPAQTQGTLIGLAPSEAPTAVLTGPQASAAPQAPVAASIHGETAEETLDALPVRSTRKVTLAAVAMMLALVLGTWWVNRGTDEEPARIAEPASVAEPVIAEPEPRLEEAEADPTLARTLPAVPAEAAVEIPPQKGDEAPARPVEPADEVTVAKEPKPVAPEAATRRRARRKAAPRRRQQPVSSDGSQYQKPPELVGEW